MSAITSWRVRGGQLAVVLVLAALWELASRSGAVDPDVLPPLTKVAGIVWRLLHDGDFLADLRITAFECLVAFALVVPLGLLAGFVLGESQTLDRTLGGALQLMM